MPIEEDEKELIPGVSPQEAKFWSLKARARRAEWTWRSLMFVRETIGAGLSLMDHGAHGDFRRGMLGWPGWPLWVVTAMWIAEVLTPRTPRHGPERKRWTREQRDRDLLQERALRGMDPEESMALRRTYILRSDLQPRLQGGRRRAWAVGEIRLALALETFRIVSRPTIRKALAYLHERGVLRREDRGKKGGRPVYRFARLWDVRDEIDASAYRVPVRAG